MAVLSLMNELKAILIANENNVERLKEVAHQLTAFYRTNPIKPPEGLSPEDIFDELCLLPTDPDHTPQTRLVKQHEYKTKLLLIINSIIENTKSKKTSNAVSPKKFLTKVRENSLEVIIHFFKVIVLHVKGIGEKGMKRAVWLTVFVVCLIGFFYWWSNRDSKPEQPVNFTKSADTLFNKYTNKKLYYEREREILKNAINDEPNIERRRTLLKDLRTIESKLDTLDGGILPILERIKKNEVDSADLSSIDAYKKKFQNF